MAKINCDHCGKEFNRKLSAVKKVNFCSLKCYSDSVPKTTRPCGICGKEVTRVASIMLEHVFCSRKCTSVFTSQRMTDMNIELNPYRMTDSTRTKIKIAQTMPDSERVSYAKHYGKHLHRVVAEEMLGRPLVKGEVVHHIDENKQNNDPSNLMVFPSQADHARHHLAERRSKKE